MEESSQTTAIAPVRPLAGYIGGKRSLARRLIAKIEATPHETYAEAFVGLGGVFLRRRSRPRAEVINDRSRDVATLFRVLQRHYLAFVEMIRWQLTTRAEFERLVATDPDTLTDLERSARFLYLQRTAFGGKVAGRSFGVSPGRSAHFDVTKLGPMLEEVHERLAGVVVECLPYQDFLRRYDRPGTLTYLDPPYWGSEDDYGKGMFGRDDFECLAELLKRLQGPFILSINDRLEIRELFGWATIEEAEASYSVAREANGRRRFSELIITSPG